MKPCGISLLPLQLMAGKKLPVNIKLGHSTKPLLDMTAKFSFSEDSFYLHLYNHEVAILNLT